MTDIDAGSSPLGESRSDEPYIKGTVEQAVRDGAQGFLEAAEEARIVDLVLEAIDGEVQRRVAFFVDCARTPLMRDVMGERDRYLAALRDIAAYDGANGLGYEHPVVMAEAALSGRPS